MPSRAPRPGTQFTESFSAFTGRMRTFFEAGFALKVIFSPVNGLMPSRAFVAGFFTRRIFARPGSVATPFCFTNQPTLADICLAPQMANARRFDCDLAPYPLLVAIDAGCRALPAFAAARPEAMPDYSPAG